MLPLKRQNDILRLLEDRKEMTVKEICAALYYSPATVRRDLSELESRGLLKRSFGGAVLTESYAEQLPLTVRAAKNIAAKKHICAKAARLISNGDTLFLDASSTTYFLAPHLKSFSDLTVITNNPHLSIILSEMKIRNFCTGGEMLYDSIALVGSDAERFINGIHAHKCFFSARGLCQGEISDSSKAERDVKLAMLARSDQHIFLCDSSKSGLRYPYRITELCDVDRLIDETESATEQIPTRLTDRTADTRSAPHRSPDE